MSKINISSVMKKVRGFARSVDGKLLMQNVIDNYIKSGIKKTHAGDRIISAKDMEILSRKFADSLIKTALSYDLPASVMKNIQSISCTKPYLVSDEVYRVDLFFTDDLSRDSLYSEKYDGIVNIIALFNNGYLASDNVYGYWDNHPHKGDWNVLRTNFGDDFAYIKSKIGRPALQFMQQAVDDFNSVYGNEYNTVAVLDEIYEQVPTVAAIKQ